MYGIFLLCISVVCIVSQAQILKVKNPEIYRLHIVSDIAFRFATTNVTSYLANNADDALEVQFKVTLPKEAFISNFSMVIDGVLYQGDVKEKQAAQKQYDKAKKKGQSAGQVKAKSPKESNIFKIQVNVAARSKVEFSLTYQELLKRRLGIYEHVINIDPGQVVRDLKVEVNIQESKKIVLLEVPELRTSFQNSIEQSENPLAQVERLSNHHARVTYAPDTQAQLEASTDGIAGQFVVQYDVERELGGGEIQVVDGYFVHYFAPSGLDPVSKNVLFILDVSGSMSGDKIRQVKEAMNTILDDLRPGDKFNIITFADYIFYWDKNGMVAVNEDSILRAKTFIKDMHASGGTNINDALLGGVSFLKRERESDTEVRPSIIIFLTDGQPSSGVTRTESITNNMHSANQGASSLFTLGFGNDVDFPFLTKMSLQNDGFARKIYIDADPALQLQNFYEEVSTPVLANVKLNYLDNSVDINTVTATDFSTYFQGSEIVVAGKLTDDTTSNVISQVSGHASSGYMEMDLSVNVARLETRYRRYDFPRFTERLWAYLTIKKMLKTMVQTTDPTVKTEAEQKALELALKYSFVTPLTSMVVTKPEEPEEPQEPTVEEQAEEEKSADPGYRGPQNAQRAYPQGIKRNTFVDNDPHFVVQIAGMEEGICFDVNGQPGDIFQLIYDRKNGLVVNGQVNAPDLQPQNINHVPTYFSNVAIMHSGKTIQIEPRKIFINGKSIPWKQVDNKKIKDMVLTLTSRKHLVITIGDEIELMVLRHLSNVPNPRKMDYLGFYIKKADGLDAECHGLLGQFKGTKVSVLPPKEELPKPNTDINAVHQDNATALLYSQNSTEKPVRTLHVVSPDGSQRHLVAHLGQRRNMNIKEHIPCWHIRNNGRGLLQGKFQDYIVPKLSFKYFAIHHSGMKKSDAEDLNLYLKH